MAANSQKHPLIFSDFPHFPHGGDYNPDQWPPEVWDDDVRLMGLAGCNAMSVGIFSWAHLEPREGEFTFDWLDEAMDRLAANGVRVGLATPTASHPAWMSRTYPQVVRQDRDGNRRHGGRVHFCPSSQVYREKCATIVRKLAERYKAHPALLLWHVHNEYVGECVCEACVAAFRDWLRARYGSIEALNHAWWNAFWGHTYGDFEEVVPFDGSVQCMTLDWKRFVSDHVLACFRNERDILHEATPGVPVTTNTYSYFVDYLPQSWAAECDVIAWDNYPMYHDRPADLGVALESAFQGDFYRCLKHKPFLLMETTPSSTNWAPVMKLKRPGVHRLTALQAIAHGAESVMYFQWRKSRGSAEKFHGAVVDHVGHENTRVFSDIADLGRTLPKLEPVLGSASPADVAVIYDKQNDWAIAAAQGPRGAKRDYVPTCLRHYRSFWRRGVGVDVICEDDDLGGYKLLIAPMLYMVRPGVAERIERFVRAGGTFVTTYWSGIADQSDLVHLGGWPGPLRGIVGVWAEEIDVLYDDEFNQVVPVPGNGLHLAGEYRAEVFCDQIHAETAAVLATYGREFYAGQPALTVNRLGDGEAYYLASRNEQRFLDDFYGVLARRLGIRPALDADLPEGVTVQRRTDGERDYLFVLNFACEGRTVHLGAAELCDLETGQPVAGRLHLPPHGSRVLVR